MKSDDWKNLIQSFDDRRDIYVAGDQKETIQFCTDQFLEVAKKSIKNHDHFSVALSGGSTPKAIFENLAAPPNRQKIDWKKVWLFWGDERSVPPSDPESNYHMAMKAGFSSLNLPPEHIFRLQAEDELEQHAKRYEELIKSKLPDAAFDLVMLGMGDDGHTASLFPKTHALHTTGQLVVPNYVPQKETWRMTLTFDCINQAKNIAIYVLGKNKAEMVKRVLTSDYDPDDLPIQKVGTTEHKALWILDKEAASEL